MLESVRRVKNVPIYQSAISGLIGGPGVNVVRLAALFQARLAVALGLVAVTRLFEKLWTRGSALVQKLKLKCVLRTPALRS